MNHRPSVGLYFLRALSMTLIPVLCAIPVRAATEEERLAEFINQALAGKDYHDLLDSCRRGAWALDIDTGLKGNVEASASAASGPTRIKKGAVDQLTRNAFARALSVLGLLNLSPKIKGELEGKFSIRVNGMTETNGDCSLIALRVLLHAWSDRPREWFPRSYYLKANPSTPTTEDWQAQLLKDINLFKPSPGGVVGSISYSYQTVTVDVWIRNDLDKRHYDWQVHCIESEGDGGWEQRIATGLDAGPKEPLSVVGFFRPVADNNAPSQSGRNRLYYADPTGDQLRLTTAGAVRKCPALS